MKKTILFTVFTLAFCFLQEKISAQVIKLEELVKIASDVSKYRYNASDTSKRAIGKTFFPLIEKGFLEISLVNHRFLAPGKTNETIFTFENIKTKDTIMVRLEDNLPLKGHSASGQVEAGVITRDYGNYQKWVEETSFGSDDYSMISISPLAYSFYNIRCRCRVVIQKDVSNTTKESPDGGVTEEYHTEKNPAFKLVIIMSSSF